MSGAQIPRLRPAGLDDLLRRRKQESKVEINCMTIGTIVTFNAEDQTADIRINFQKVLKASTFNASDLPVDQTVDYPLLVKCPVVILSGGGAHLSFPIAAGDVCLVLFCDRELDGWWESGQARAPLSERVHDLSDGVALVGVYSKASPISDYYSGGIRIKLGNGYITVDASGNIIINGTTVSINP